MRGVFTSQSTKKCSPKEVLVMGNRTYDTATPLCGSEQDRRVHCAEGEIGGTCILDRVIGYIGTKDVVLRSIYMSLGRGEVHRGGGEATRVKLQAYGVETGKRRQGLLRTATASLRGSTALP